MHTAAREASSPAAATSSGPKSGLCGARPNVAQPSTTPRATRGTDRNDAQLEASSWPPGRREIRSALSSSSRSNRTGLRVCMARKLGESSPKTITSPGRSRLSVTAAGWPASRVTSRRITAPCPAWGATGSSAASSRSNTKMAMTSANVGTATSATSRAVRGRSSVVPIRSAASRSQPGLTAGETCCPITSTPAPGPPSGSQRMATGPLPPAKAMLMVAVQTRPADDLGQRVTGQLTLARASHQHVTYVAPGYRRRSMAEQPLGGHRP